MAVVRNVPMAVGEWQSSGTYHIYHFAITAEVGELDPQCV